MRSTLGGGGGGQALALVEIVGMAEMLEMVGPPWGSTISTIPAISTNAKASPSQPSFRPGAPMELQLRSNGASFELPWSLN